TASANACACQGSANTGPPSSRGKLGNAATRSLLVFRSDVLKVAIPKIKINRISCRGGLAPQLLRSKTHRIQMLRMLALKMRVGIRKNENAVMACNLSVLAP